MNTVSKSLIGISLFVLANTTYTQAQFIFETPEGSPLTLSPDQGQGTSLLLNVNTADSKLSTTGYFSLAKQQLGDDKITRHWLFAGLSGKATDGILSVINGGNFNTGVNVSAGYSRFKLFDKWDIGKPDKFTDWVTIKGNYQRDELTIFKQDTAFSNQIFNETVNGYGLDLSYVARIKGRGESPDDHFIGILLGYNRGHNYGSLSKVEIRDHETIMAPDSSFREVTTKTTTGRVGSFRELSKWPLRFSYSYVPDISGSDNVKPGFMLYYSLTPAPGELPDQKLGLILFALKLNKKETQRVQVFLLDRKRTFQSFQVMISRCQGFLNREVQKGSR